MKTDHDLHDEALASPRRVRVRKARRPVFRSTPDLDGRRPPAQATHGREFVSRLLAVLLAGGAVAYAYRPWAWLWLMAATTGVAFLAWLPDVVRRRAWRPRTTVAAALAGLLVAYGVTACFNGAGEYDASAGRVMPVPHVAWLPAAVDASNAWPSLAAVAAALAAMVMGTDLGKSARLRRRLLAAIALAGGLTAALGVAERFPPFDGIAGWDRASPWSDGASFGLMGYHNHAGTMMNLAMPSLAGVALGGSRRRRAIGSLGVVTLLLAAAVNVSRTGLAIGGVAATLSVAILWMPRAGATELRRWALPAAGAAAVVALLAGVLVLARPAVVERFSHVADGGWGSYRPRVLHWTAGAELFARAPIFGLGPGGYRMLAETTSTHGYYLGPTFAPGRPYTPALNAMNDSLQTLVEWGVVGAALWATLLLAAGLNAARGLAAPVGAVARREIALVVVAAFAIFAHSLVDPPLQAPAFQLIAGVLVGLLFAAPHWRGRPGDPIAAFFE